MSELYNLARMSTGTTGTGTITLTAPISGFLSFAASGVSNGETISYGIADGANSEIGTGVYSSTGPTLTRNVTTSTNSNTAISLSGTAQVFITPRKEDLLNPAKNLSDVASASTARTNLAVLGTAANLSDVASASTARTNLGLGTAATRADAYFAQTANNLSDLANAGTARTNLGLGTAAVRADTDFPRTDAAQSFTAAQQAQVRSNTGSAPFEALADSGLQINGGMTVSQYNGTSAMTTAGGTNFVIDGFNLVVASTTAVFSAQQVAVTDLPGFRYALQLSVTTAVPTIGSDYVLLDHPIEGYDFFRAKWGTANAVPISVGIWLCLPVAGTYAITLTDTPQSTSAIGSFTIAAANTWQYCTITFAAVTTGTWGTGNGVGGILRLTLDAGGQSGHAIANVTNGTTYKAIRITGLCILADAPPPTAERLPFMMRPHARELELCMRRWEQRSVVAGTSPPYPGTAITWLVEKRAQPTLTVSFPQGGSGATFLQELYAPTKGFWQNGAHSTTNTVIVTGDARLS